MVWQLITVESEPRKCNQLEGAWKREIGDLEHNFLRWSAVFRHGDSVQESIRDLIAFGD